MHMYLRNILHVMYMYMYMQLLGEICGSTRTSTLIPVGSDLHVHV